MDRPRTRTYPTGTERGGRVLPVRAQHLAVLAVVLLLAACSPERSTVVALAPPVAPGSHATDPSIVVDPAGRAVLLAWLAGDSTGWRVWFANSADRGATWSSPIAVSPPGELLEPQGEATPRLVCDSRGRVAIMWATATELPGQARVASELRIVRSLDGGRNWGAPVTLHVGGEATPRTHRFHDLASSDDGRLVAAWLVSGPRREGHAQDGVDSADASIHMASSGDFGEHWGPDSPQWSWVCPCCRVGVGIDLTGGVIAAYRRHAPGHVRDVMLARPGGPPVRLFDDGWSTEECPRSGPGFKVARDGTLRVAWFTGGPGRNGVWFRQGLPERFDSTLTPIPVLVDERLATVHVSVGDAGMSGTLIAFDADSSGAGRLSLVRVEASGQRIVERLSPAGVSDVVRPQVAASNTKRTAYVAWTERVGDERRMKLLRWNVGR